MQGQSSTQPAIEAFGTVGTAMITPFSDSGALDLAAAEAVARYLVDHGNDMLVVSGTTGESPTTTDEEKTELLTAVKQAVGGEAKIVAGVGTNDTAHSCTLARQAAAAGADGLLVVTPYYSKPPQGAIAAHIRQIADSTDLPVMVYDIPGRAGVPINSQTLIDLADHPQVLAVKDAKGDLAASMQVMAESSLAYYSGEDALNFPLLAAGAVGIVSVAGHVCSAQFATMIEHIQAHRLADARQLNADLMGIVDAVMNHMPGVISAKAAMQILGVTANRATRMPLLPADDEQYHNLYTTMKESGYLK